MNVQPSVFSLPNEILVAIVAAAAEDDYVDFPLEQGGDHPEWTVSQVSRRFRDIVIGAPTLWTVVEVHLILKESIEIFKLYLERSRGCKIWANLREVSWDREIVPHHVIAEGLSHIVPHIKRIQRLCIMSNPESVAAMLAPFQYAEAPYLEYLQLRVPGFWLRSMEIFPPEAPRLTRFVLHGFRPRFPVPQWAGTLTHLEYWETEDEKDEDGNSFFATIVSQCSSLVHLYVDTLQMRYRGSPLRIPTLKSLHLLINPDADDALDLLKVVELFDTPAVTDLTFDYAHGDHICVLFNPTSVPRSVFPAVTSLSFVNNHCGCGSEIDTRPTLQKISAPPLRLFPAVSSLTIIGECFMEHIVEELLGPGSQPWPLLDTVTLCPKEGALQEVYSTIQRAVRSKREQEQAVPKFRFSPRLFYQDYWADNGVEVELFDPMPIIDALG